MGILDFVIIVEVFRQSPMSAWFLGQWGLRLPLDRGNARQPATNSNHSGSTQSRTGDCHVSSKWRPSPYRDSVLNAAPM